MKTGIVVVDKPRGVSSAQVVARVKRALRPEKIGHSGTLDPLATGVLVCLLGHATRLAQYAEGGGKVYTGTIKFGVTTDSDDIDGVVLKENPVQFSDADLQEAAKRFRGELSQIPPRISAVKVDGVRAYQKARNNEELQLNARTVTVRAFKIERTTVDSAKFEVHCSKGTYIRSIARDLGNLLGSGGIITSLRRERSEPFSIELGVTLDAVSDDAILPWQTLFPSGLYLGLGDEEIRSLAGGDQRFLASSAIATATTALGSPEARLLLYGRDGSRVPEGILLRDNGSLRLGLHIGK